MTHEAVRERRDQPISCPICAAPGHRSFDSRFVEVHRCENEQCAHLFAIGVDANHGVMHELGTDGEESRAPGPAQPSSGSRRESQGRSWRRSRVLAI
jgi:hypothetical protein